MGSPVCAKFSNPTMQSHLHELRKQAEMLRNSSRGSQRLEQSQVSGLDPYNLPT